MGFFLLVINIKGRRMVMTKLARTTLYLDPQLKEWIRNEAFKQRISENRLIVKAIEAMKAQNERGERK
jgi:predicted HicB family RNase H-like nuclease